MLGQDALHAMQQRGQAPCRYSIYVEITTELAFYYSGDLLSWALGAEFVQFHR